MSLSPDGRYIAYDFPQAEEGPERDIFLLASDGSREVPLVRHPAHEAGPMWTPDGSRVLFFSDGCGGWICQPPAGKPELEGRMRVPAVVHDERRCVVPPRGRRPRSATARFRGRDRASAI